MESIQPCAEPHALPMPVVGWKPAPTTPSMALYYRVQRVKVA